jgi:hypothetical protein
MDILRIFVGTRVVIGSALVVGMLLFPSPGSGQVAGQVSSPKQSPGIVPPRQGTAGRPHAAAPGARGPAQRAEGRRPNDGLGGSQGDHQGDRKKPPGGKSARDQRSGVRPSQLFQDRFDLRVMSWGNGSGAPTSGKKLVIVGTDNRGLLHIRIFDAGGKRVMDTDETRLADSQVVAVATLKQQLPGLLASHVPTGAEKGRVIRKVTLIFAQTSQDSQRQPRQAQSRQRSRKSQTARSGSGRDTGSSPNPVGSTAARGGQ